MRRNGKSQERSDEEKDEGKSVLFFTQKKEARCNSCLLRVNHVMVKTDTTDSTFCPVISVTALVSSVVIFLIIVVIIIVVIRHRRRQEGGGDEAPGTRWGSQLLTWHSPHERLPWLTRV